MELPGQMMDLTPLLKYLAKKTVDFFTVMQTVQEVDYGAFLAVPPPSFIEI